MKFLVFIKQVPETADIRFNPETKTIVREGVRCGINAYDRRALSEAIRYRNEKGGEVIVATMGPAQARTALAEALVLGADRAVHIEDRRLAGSDTLATARALAAAARRIGYDLIFAGQHSTDSETGQVPPAIAEILGLPCAVAVKSIKYAEASVQVVSETDEGHMVLDLPLPAVISTAERLIKPLKAKDFDPAAAPVDRIQTFRLEDLDLSEQEVGPMGSPTWVADIRQQLTGRHPEMFDGSDPEIAARRIVAEIASAVKRAVPPETPPVAIAGDREYWCVLEKHQGQLRKVSFEMLSGAAALASVSGGKVCAVFVGPPLAPQEVLMVSAYGGNTLYQATIASSHPDEMVALLCDRITALRPYAVFLPATSTGRAIAPRIATRLNLGLTGDCVGLAIDSEGRVQHLKPAFGGNIVAPIYSKTFPQMATIRPGALTEYGPRSADQVSVVNWDLPSPVVRRFQILDTSMDGGADAANLDHARVVVGVGMGLGQENVPMAVRLADAYDGAVGATRRVVDAGWLQRQYQVGLTGKFIAPTVYLGFGVSGPYNHTIGIQKSGKIIAVNSDPKAEIFLGADLCVVGDCPSILRAMIDIVEH